MNEAAEDRRSPVGGSIEPPARGGALDLIDLEHGVTSESFGRGELGQVRLNAPVAGAQVVGEAHWEARRSPRRPFFGDRARR